MAYHYVWLVWSSAFLLPWLLLYALFPQHRVPMWRSSLVMAPFGLTEVAMTAICGCRQTPAPAHITGQKCLETLANIEWCPTSKNAVRNEIIEGLKQRFPRRDSRKSQMTLAEQELDRTVTELTAPGKGILATSGASQ